MADIIFPTVAQKNQKITTLAASITNSATSLDVVSATALGIASISGGNFHLITLVALANWRKNPITLPETFEIVKVTAVSIGGGAGGSDRLTITRAQDGTTGIAFSAGDIAEARMTGGHLSAVYNALTDGTTGELAIKSIGAVTAGTGRFTTFDATAAVTLSPANAAVILSPTGTGVVTIAPATAGTINNCSIGATTPLTGAFTTVTGTQSTVPVTGILRALKSASDSAAAPTTVTTSNYIQVGGREYGANSYRLIGFGYNNGGTTVSPAFIGYFETSISGQTKGDLIFGTRTSTTGSTEPTIRMRILTSGEVGIGMTPVNTLDVTGTLGITSTSTLVGAVTVGTAGTTRGVINLVKGSGTTANASYIQMQSVDGTAYYLFFENDGTLKRHTAVPTANGDGTEIGTQT